MFSVAFKYNSNLTLMNQWDYVLSNFKPDKVYIVGDIDKATLSNPLKQAVLIDNVNELPDKPLVILSPSHARKHKGIVPLDKFIHPENAIYYFGSDSEIMLNEFKVESIPVFIPTDTTDDMYSFVAYSVVNWDRRMKLGNK